MPTVYYTDGTSQKYKYYNDICYSDPYFDTQRIPFMPFNELAGEYMINVLPLINIKLIENKIFKTKTININGLYEFEELKYIYKYTVQMIYPVINEDILKKIMNEYKFVKKFYLSNNLIKDGLLDFTFFADLEKIKLSRNLLSEIPPSIFKLRKLKKLVIEGVSNIFPGHVNISTIPKEINNLQSLLTLNLGHQNLTFLPSEFKELQNLKELYLSSNKFTELPIEICNLKNLKILEMNWMEMSIPDDIMNLKNLEVLKLQGNYEVSGVDFENLPKDIFVKTKLKALNIDNFTELSYNSWKIKRNLIINTFHYFIEILYDDNTKIINFNKYIEFNDDIPIKKIYKLIDDDLYIKNMKQFVKIGPY